MDIEDKIFGPFTFREFVYLAGGAGLCFVLYKLLGLLLAAVPILLVAGFSGALIFYRPNSKPFLNMIESGFKYFTQDKLYIWKRKISKSAPSLPAGRQAPALPFGEGLGGANKLTGSKLRDLAWSLDVLDLKKEK